MISRPRLATRTWTLGRALALTLSLGLGLLPVLGGACSRGKGGGPGGAPAGGPASAAAGPSSCPTGTAGPPVEPARVIDDFAGGGPLEGRTRTGAGFTVREQFQATPAAHFDQAPAVDAACGGGAAHIKGTAAGPGATYTLVLSGSAAPGVPARSLDASGSTGITFRAALGNARASRVFSVELGVLGSHWSYAKDFVVDGTDWQRVDVRWSDLRSAPGAPPFAPTALNQIVFPLMTGAAVDLYLDDVALLR